MFELIATLIIVVTAVVILVRSIKRKAKTGCDCGSCSGHCPNFKK
jgi:ferrous iron transport protein B